MLLPLSPHSTSLMAVHTENQMYILVCVCIYFYFLDRERYIWTLFLYLSLDTSNGCNGTDNDKREKGSNHASKDAHKREK